MTNYHFLLYIYIYIFLYELLLSAFKYGDVAYLVTLVCVISFVFKFIILLYYFYYSVVE